MSDHWIHAQNRRNDQEAAWEAQLESILREERAEEIDMDLYQREDGSRFTIDDSGEVVDEDESQLGYDDLLEARVSATRSWDKLERIRQKLNLIKMESWDHTKSLVIKLIKSEFGE